MSGTQGSVRQEAERLMVTMMAMASQGGLGSGGLSALGDAVLGALGQVAGHAPGSTSTGSTSTGSGSPEAGSPEAGGGWATGAPECCVCPICRVIAGLRDPDPATAERLATGAGDFAAGVASLLRAFSATTGSPGTTNPGTPGSGTPGSGTTGNDAGQRTSTTPEQRPPASDPWAAATAAPPAEPA